MALIIERPGDPKRSVVVGGFGSDPDPRIGSTITNAGGPVVRVKTLVAHQSEAAWHPVGEEYDEEPMRAKDKASRRIVEIVDGGAKSAAPARNKATGPSADKALEPWPLKTLPEEYIAQHEGASDLSDAVAERLKLARAHVKAAKE